MKKYYLVALFSLSVLFSNAQFLSSLIGGNAAFSDSLGKIVGDFRNNFRTIQADPLPSQGQTNMYESKVKLPGAIESYIYRSHSVNDSIATWQSVMYRGDDKNKAVKIYKTLFREVKATKIKLSDKSSASFSGKLEKESDMAFVVSYLTVDIPDSHYNKFTAEVELTNNMMTWEVHLNMHNSKTDADLMPGNNY